MWSHSSVVGGALPTECVHFDPAPKIRVGLIGLGSHPGAHKSSLNEIGLPDLHVDHEVVETQRKQRDQPRGEELKIAVEHHEIGILVENGGHQKGAVVLLDALKLVKPSQIRGHRDEQHDQEANKCLGPRKMRKKRLRHPSISRPRP